MGTYVGVLEQPQKAQLPHYPQGVLTHFEDPVNVLDRDLLGSLPPVAASPVGGAAVTNQLSQLAAPRSVMGAGTRHTHCDARGRS
jgi:hypothetical protein